MGFSDCQDALGMETSAVSDAQITASSEWSSTHAAPQGRLHLQNTVTKTGAWSARINNVNQWLQVDLISQYTKVTGVATQGRNSYSQWVTKYNLQYGDDGVNFLYYMELGGTEKKVKPISFSSTMIRLKQRLFISRNNNFMQLVTNTSPSFSLPFIRDILHVSLQRIEETVQFSFA